MAHVGPNSIRTLIVDDEPPARARLRRLLEKQPDIEIVGESDNGDDAICAIAEHRPDLLFLDIEMPGADGLTVLRTVRENWLPCTIFTTAHAQHAVEAFDLRVLDYLLKPYAEARLVSALERVREQFAPDAANGAAAVAAAPAGPRPAVERFLIKSGERYAIVRAEEVRWAEAAGNYAVLHTAGGNHVLRRTIQTLESELDPKHFFRASRSAIVRLDEIVAIDQSEPREFVLQLRDGARVPLTRGLREIQSRLEKAN